ncbi:hypothetical protein R1sor_006790 [Riccia sorocarpa]|uniref:Reverse transcriptase domain-containing protein n=1 Tax=Riccia sorocarpa TaxID=122646 RepID=A0ABD3HUW0_9MARC
MLGAKYKTVAVSAIGRSRGVALLIREDVQILETGGDVNGRVVWAKIRWQEEDFNVASVYAHNDAVGRTEFWKFLTDSLPTGSWVLLGDWNSVVNPADSSSTSNHQNEEETLEFHRLCSHLRLRDAREIAIKRKGPMYTRSQTREGRFIWSRIDRAYVAVENVAKVVHHSQFQISDHMPLSVFMSAEIVRPGEGQQTKSTYFKADFLVVEEGLEEFEGAWKNLEEKHGDRPALERFTLCWDGLRKEIKQKQYEKIERFLREGDANTAYFFHKFKKRRARITIDKIKREDGTLLESPEQIKSEVLRSFTCLYSRQEPDVEADHCTRELLSTVQSQLTTEQRLLMDDIPTDRELEDALSLLPYGKSPGIDGMGKEVMSILWPVIGKLYCQAMIEFWQGSPLPHCFKDGLLVLLPKIDDPELLGHWRPITLLNTTYKVLAKVIAMRLALILPALVPVQQQGFIKNRTTQNCILLFALTHEALKRERKHAIFFMLDQEKAYDRLLPEYLWAVMRCLQFPEQVICRIQNLQLEAETRVLVNGDMLPSFPVLRGVRQGCPLSPLLFSLASIPFITTLRRENDSGNILPVHVGRDVVVSCACLADDTAVYVQMHEQSARNLFHLLMKLQKASGGKTNWQKSKALIISRNTHPSPWLHGFGMQIVGERDQTRYLGASLITTWKGVDNGRAMLAAVTKKAQSLTSPLLSFEARIIGLKHAIFGSAIYQLMSASFKKGALRRIDSVLRGYIWSKDREGNQKRSLVRWDQIALPEVWGGMGVFELQRFQQALLCRTLLKVIQNPSQTLWAPVLFKGLLQRGDLDLGANLTLIELPDCLKGCPVATLILTSWSRFVSEFRWRPSSQASLQDSEVKTGLFLLARTCVGHKRAVEIAELLHAACISQQIHQLSHFKTTLQSRSFPVPEFPEAPLILPALQHLLIGQSPPQFDTVEWKLPEGEDLQLGWRGKKIYEILLGNVSSEQTETMNKKWCLNWDVNGWKEVWRCYLIKGLPKRHKYFMWRILARALYDGKREQKFNKPGVACSFCKTGVEDTNHALFLCPRWDLLWQEELAKIPGWRELTRERQESRSLPEVPLQTAIFTERRGAEASERKL